MKILQGFVLLPKVSIHNADVCLGAASAETSTLSLSEKLHCLGVIIQSILILSNASGYLANSVKISTDRSSVIRPAGEIKPFIVFD